MEIKVLGTGCAGCKALHATVEQVVKELALEAVITKEEDLMKIMEYNVMTLPALVVDGKVVAKGKLSAKEVKRCINQVNQIMMKRFYSLPLLVCFLFVEWLRLPRIPMWKFFIFMGNNVV